MPDYPCNRVPGGTVFFSVNLLDRRSHLLVTHIAFGAKARAPTQWPDVSRRRLVAECAALFRPTLLHPSPSFGERRRAHGGINSVDALHRRKRLYLVG